jgi:hypothetical protein
MPSLFKALGAVLCLVFALCLAAPSAHADSFTYTYTDTFLGLSLTTAAISAVTMQTTVADLTATSTSGITAGCGITSVGLDFGGLGSTFIKFSGCSLFNAFNPDAFALSDYSTPGTYVSPLISSDTLVVTAVATPEPSSLAFMLSGVGLVFAMRKRLSGLQLAS